MENSEQIFAIALGLEEPWHVEKIVFNKEQSQLDIYYHCQYVFLCFNYFDADKD